MARSHRVAVAMLASAMLAAPTGAVVPAAAFGAADLCYGQKPTIVGTPGGELVGTIGGDVVVTAGAYQVHTGGGDDLVCVTGTPTPTSITVRLGAGDDRIDSRAMGPTPESQVSIIPGRGSDEVIGGVANESVKGPPPGDAGDVVRTAAGRDIYEGGFAAADVDLGSGLDRVYWKGDAPGSVLRGGTGRDQLWMFSPSRSSVMLWKLDNRTGRLSADGEVIAQWDSFSGFISRLDEAFVFVGGSEAEQVVLSRRPSSSDLRLGAGDDMLSTSRGRSSRIAGGSGNDTIGVIDFHQGFVLDLGAGLLRPATPRAGPAESVVGFENASAAALGKILLKGTDGPNRLRAGGLTDPNGVNEGRHFDATILGLAGDDFLIGGYFDDTLVGGAGHDIARGKFGTDVCSAEEHRGCENTVPSRPNSPGARALPLDSCALRCHDNDVRGSRESRAVLSFIAVNRRQLAAATA